MPWVRARARASSALGGAVRVRWSVEPRFGYGGEETRARPRSAACRLRSASACGSPCSPGTPATPEHRDAAVAGAAELVRGRRGPASPASRPTASRSRVRRARRSRCGSQGTCDRGAGGSGASAYEGPGATPVERSALALKLLDLRALRRDRGGRARRALPERIGGAAQLRLPLLPGSATPSFALDALSRLGFREQVHASLSWLLDATEPTHPRLPPLYGLDGPVPRRERRAAARRLPRLPSGAARERRRDAAPARATTATSSTPSGTTSSTATSLDPATARRLAEIATFVCEVWRQRGLPASGSSTSSGTTRSRRCPAGSRSTSASAARRAGPDPGATASSAGARRRREIRDFVETPLLVRRAGAATPSTPAATISTARCCSASQFEYADPTRRADATRRSTRSAPSSPRAGRCSTATPACEGRRAASSPARSGS